MYNFANANEVIIYTFMKKLAAILRRSPILNISLIFIGVVIVVILLIKWNGRIVSGSINFKELEAIYLQGNKLMQAKNVDGALTNYSKVVNSLPDSDDLDVMELKAKAFNNMGYALLYGKKDYLGAYSYFLKSLSCYRKTDYGALYPYIFLNIANIKAGKLPAEALELYIRSFNYALDSDNREIVNIAYVNMINIAIDQGKLQSIGKEIRIFDSLPENDTVSLNKFSRQIHHGAMALLEGNAVKAAGDFGKAVNSVDSPLTPLHYKMSAYGNLAEVLMCYGDTLSALNVIAEIETLSQRVSASEVRVSLYKSLSSIYKGIGNVDKSIYYHIRFLELSDSTYNFTTGHNLELVESQCKLDEMGADIRKLSYDNERAKTLLWLSVVIIFLIVVFSVITYFQKRRANELLKSLYVSHNKLIDRDTTTYHLDNMSALRNDVSCGHESIDTCEKKKYSASSIPESKKKRYAGILTDIATNSESLFRTGFSVEQLAEEAGMKNKEVSQIINELWHMNFNTWVNSYRCREAAKRLENPQFDRMTIEAIAESLGFRNRSHFASVFKQTTGMTPAEYRRASRLV